MPDAPSPSSADRPTSRAAFLGGLLAFVALVALSVVGIGHARTIEGAANAQYWLVTAGVAAALGFVTFSLGRTPARTPAGEAARRIGVALAAIWLAVFLWETIAVGSGAFAGPFELGWAAWKG
jgi:hypothetical protein